MVANDFSRREFLRSATASAIALSNTALETLVLSQQPKVVTPEEAFADEQNLTGARQLYLNQEVNWVTSRIAQDLPEKQVYWVDSFTYDHSGKQARPHVETHARQALEAKLIKPEELEEKVEEGITDVLWSGYLVNVMERTLGSRQKIPILFFPETFAAIYKPEYQIREFNLTNSIGPSEETIRMNIASAVNAAFAMYHGIDLGNGLRIDKNNANTINSDIFSTIITTESLIRDIEFAQKYLSKQTANFALSKLVDHLVHVEGYRTNERAETDFEKRLYVANNARILQVIGPYLPKQ